MWPVSAPAASSLMRPMHWSVFCIHRKRRPCSRRRVSNLRTRRKEPSQELRDVLRDAVAERPILLLNFEEIDEDVLRPQAGLLREQFDDARKKRFLLIDVARVGDGELDQHQVVGALD